MSYKTFKEASAVARKLAIDNDAIVDIQRIGEMWAIPYEEKIAECERLELENQGIEDYIKATSFREDEAMEQESYEMDDDSGMIRTELDGDRDGYGDSQEDGWYYQDE